MPTYDYECKKCEHTFEVFQSMSDDPLTECPECNGEVRRLIGGGLGVIFKGEGFYVTDNRSGSPAAGSSKDASKESSGSSAKEKKESSPKTDTANGSASSDSGGKSSSKEAVKS